MKTKGSVKTNQADVISWHAKVRQMQVDLVYLRANQKELTLVAREEMLDSLLADISNLESKLPPVQLKLPI